MFSNQGKLGCLYFITWLLINVRVSCNNIKESGVDSKNGYYDLALLEKIYDLSAQGSETGLEASSRQISNLNRGTYTNDLNLDLLRKLNDRVASGQSKESKAPVTQVIVGTPRPSLSVMNIPENLLDELRELPNLIDRLQTVWLRLLTKSNKNRQGDKEYDDQNVQLVYDTDSSMRSLIDIVQSISSQVKPHPITTSTTTTTTTTVSPLVDLAKTISTIPEKLSIPTKAIVDTPAKILNNVLKSTLSVGEAGMNAANLTQAITKAVAPPILTGTIINPQSQAKNKDEDEFYQENDDATKGEYYSTECRFRVACELGRQSQVPELVKKVATSKFFKDLQNKYTKAYTYGMKKPNCERYFCVYLSLIPKLPGLSLFGGRKGNKKGEEKASEEKID